MNPVDRFYEYCIPATVLAVGLCALATLLWLAWLPGGQARRRNHPHARAIALLGWLSILIWPLWAVALIWACRAPVMRVDRIVRIPVSRLHARNAFDGDGMRGGR
jgi:hypothetical protein